MTRITIATMDGLIEVEADIVAPGLAVHRAYRQSGWAATHVASGRKLCRTTDPVMARLIARAVARLADWEQQKDELATMVAEMGRAEAVAEPDDPE